MICPAFPPPEFFIFSSDVPQLLYYSHFPAIIISLLVGFFVWTNDTRALINRLLLGIALSFSLWAFLDLIVWTNNGSDTIMLVWSFFGLASSLISILSVYFVYAFIKRQDVTSVHKIVFFLLLLPVLALTPTIFNLSGFDLELCGASGFEGVLFLSYYTFLGVIAMIWSLFIYVRNRSTMPQQIHRQALFITIGIEAFLSMFMLSGFLVSYLNDTGILTNYDFEQYGLFGMIVFMTAIAFVIVRFKAFNIGLIAAQALCVTLIILIGSEFFFVTNLVNRILVGVTLLFTAIVSILLLRSVRSEIAQRVHIEKLALELEKSNDRQVTLIHFITHQIKGFLTKSRNVFAGMSEGDYGVLPEAALAMAKAGFDSDTAGVNTVQEILSASNIKSGKVTYTMAPFDLKQLVDEITAGLRSIADAKKLELQVNTGNAPLMVNGDRAQLVNVYKNLIDNSIKYTPSGKVAVSLASSPGKVTFEIEDTGVGITPEDMKNLFTEGGHGKESQKINTESTGFGLYIVKNIVEAHKGKVWAESDGHGKGSRFIVELPA